LAEARRLWLRRRWRQSVRRIFILIHGGMLPQLAPFASPN
jgi:hypothetical protein